MNELQRKIDSLSPEQRQQFETLLAEQRQVRQLQPENQNTVPQITPNPKQRFEPFPLTDIQQAQWFGRSGIFDITVAGHGYVEFDCKGKDLDRLEEAFQEIIKRHDQMRMLVLPNLQQQVLKDTPPYCFKRYDYRGKPREEVDAGLAEVRERMAHDILPSDSWPIFEVCASLWDEDELRIHFNFDLLVGDAWCFRVIIDEWERLYRDPTGGRPAPEELSYRDYVLALQELESSDLFERDLDYWREQLDDLPSRPTLPMLTNPESIKEVRAEHYSIRFSNAQWLKIKSLIKKKKLTPSGFFASAFSEALTLWHAGSRLTLNMTVFNRLPLHPEIDNILVGEFNSFQLLKIDNSEALSFEKRAGKVQSLMWQHLEHRYISGVKLMRELAQRSGAGAGEALMPVVFTSTLSHQEEDLPTEAPGEWVFEISQTPQVWMEHHLWEEGGQLALHIDVVKGLFPPGLIRDLVDVYEKLIHSLMDDEHAWLKTDASHLLPQKMSDLWKSYNQTQADIPSGLLHEPLLKAADRLPNKKAIVSARGNLTFRELNKRSNQLAHYLQDQGVKPGELVAVIAPKGWEQVAGTLGVLKSGAAYLPLEQDTPEERILAILKIAEVKHVLSCQQFAESFPWGESIKAVSFESESVVNNAIHLPDQKQKPEDLAYVIFTSGSTGQPKGVAIDHKAALNTIVDINARFKVNENDVLFAISALSFDLSVYDIFGGLGAGACLVMPDKQKPDPRQWIQLCQSEQVTIWNSVPALLEMLIDYSEEWAEEVPPSLRLSLMSGDWIPLSLPLRLELVNPTMDIISLGGATEASIWSIYYPIKSIAADWKSVPYGMPLLNQTMHVMDHRLQPCPPWVQGDIYIGGQGLAREYWQDTEKTQAVFITQTDSGERLYKTGDLGRLHPEGFIEFLGRDDTQVKIRGFRVELGEIESVISKIENVKRCAALALGESNRERQLVAFVVPENDNQEKQAFIEEIRKRLIAHLPEYMIPDRFLAFEQLPLSSNGKIDRKALAKTESVNEEVEYIEARNDTEARLVELWKDLLKVDRVSVKDDFFRLGGNSLIASNLLYRINEVFNVELPLAELFTATTVEAIANLVECLIVEQVEMLDDDEVELMEEF